MNYGKLTENIYDRSVARVFKTNSIKNMQYYDGAGLGADCAISAGEKAPGGISGQAMASGPDFRVAVRAYVAAVNHIIACCANGMVSGIYQPYANVTLIVPKKMREIKVRGIMEALSLHAEESGIPVLSCNVQVLGSVSEPAAVCVVSASVENKRDSTLVMLKRRALVDKDIVMTKWLGLEGTAVMASASRESLCGRYPSDIVEEAAGFYRYLSVAQEAAAAIKSGAEYLHVLREGGVFGGLWQLAADNGVGLVADLKRIPVRQETIEVCEFFDLNPYELLAGGSLLVTTSDGEGLVKRMEKEGVPAVVIGHTTAGNDRIVCRDGESRYLESSVADSIYQYYECNGVNDISEHKI